MAFNKIGTPQPMNVMNTCSCGKEATKMINGKMYCDECTTKLQEENSSDIKENE